MIKYLNFPSLSPQFQLQYCLSFVYLESAPFSQDSFLKEILFTGYLSCPYFPSVLGFTSLLCFVVVEFFVALLINYTYYRPLDVTHRAELPVASVSRHVTGGNRHLDITVALYIKLQSQEIMV